MPKIIVKEYLMRQKIDCFLACQSVDSLTETIAQLRQSPTVRHIFLMTNQKIADSAVPRDCTLLVVEQLQSSSFVMKIAEHAVAPYALLVTKPTPVSLGATALERMLLVAEDTTAALLYCDRWQVENGERKTLRDSLLDL